MADLTNIGCCGCFSILRKPSVPLEDQSAEDPNGSFYTGDDPDLSFYNGNNLDTSLRNGDDPDKSFYDRDDNDYLDESDTGPPMKSSEDVIQSRAQSGFACREIPVKETNKVFRSEVPFS
jgi:[calcium/calmodulin-dependent protein kinase] kinase